MINSVADPAHDDADEPAVSDADATETHDAARAAASLQKDVAKWSVDRHTRERIAEEELEEMPAAPAPTVSKPRAKPKAVATVAPAAPAAPGPKKPFSMSFGGVSNEDYIASLRAKGRR